MTVLLDTHVMLWWLSDDSRLSPTAIETIENGDLRLYWSLASSWEIAVKVSISKLTIDKPLHRFFADIVTDQALELVGISHEHCAQVASLPMHHRDPFDRMLVAQARLLKVPILTADSKIARYDVEVIW